MTSHCDDIPRPPKGIFRHITGISSLGTQEVFLQKIVTNYLILISSAAGLSGILTIASIVVIIMLNRLQQSSLYIFAEENSRHRNLND